MNPCLSLMSSRAFNNDYQSIPINRFVYLEAYQLGIRLNKVTRLLILFPYIKHKNFFATSNKDSSRLLLIRHFLNTL
jgi:hypothetical protein